MAKIYTSELGTVNNYAESALQNEVSDTDKIINNIKSFVSSSTNLTGSAWDKERERLNTYLPALEKRKTVSTNLLSAVKAANKVMETYISGFPWQMLARIPGLSISGGALDCIDDSWISELDACLKKAQSSYNSYQIKKDDTDKVKNSKTRSLDYYRNIITACEAVIDYLAKLQPTAQTAYSKYEAVAAEIASLQSLNHEVNQQLFDNVGGKNDKVNKVYVPIYGGGSNTGSSSIATDTGTKSKTEEVTPKATVDESTKQTTVTPTVITPVTPTITPVTPAPSSTVYVSPTVVTEVNETTTVDDIPISETETTPIIEEETQIAPSTEPIITPTPVETITTTRTTGNSTMKKVGIGLVGAAAAGAAAYGAYQVTKKIKENNDMGDKEYDDNESIENENINIKLDDNDDI